MESVRRQLVVMCGTTGSGKSTAAILLSSHLRCPVLTADETRRALAGSAINWRKNHSKAMTRKTYKLLMMSVETAFLHCNNCLIMDGTFLRRWQRRAARILATRWRAELIVVACETSDRRKRGRVTKRRDAFSGPRQFRQRVLQHHKNASEKVLASEANKLFVVRNNGTRNDLNERILTIAKLLAPREVVLLHE